MKDVYDSDQLHRALLRLGFRQVRAYINGERHYRRDADRAHAVVLCESRWATLRGVHREVPKWGGYGPPTQHRAARMDRGKFLAQLHRALKTVREEGAR